MDNIDDLKECIKQLQRELVGGELRPILTFYPMIIRCLNIFLKMMEKHGIKDFTKEDDTF